MFRRGLKTELRWLILYLAVVAFIGVSIEKLAISLVIGLLLYIAWLFYNLHKLESWVLTTRRKSAPQNTLNGIWGEIADDVILLCNRYEKDKQRLQAVVTRVQDMTSALTDGVILVDGRSNIEWWNQAAKRLFDFRQVDLGHKLTNIIRHPDFIQYFEGGNYDEPIELESVRLSGQHLQFQVHRFGIGERMVIIRDITRVFKLELMRKDFVANVSHELRTPLTVIRGYIETLADNDEIPNVWKRAFSQMQDQCQRMTALVNDLITLTKLETDDRDIRQEAVDLLPVIESILADARALSGERNHNIHAKETSDIVILGNEREIRSAISNLVFNAVKYSCDGCDISVATHILENEFVIEVTDTGAGIDPKHLPRLTERFYRVDGGRATKTGGTGLGLAIVKHVLLRHDAYLKISSKLGKGSTFSCHFPLDRLVEHNADIVS